MVDTGDCCKMRLLHRFLYLLWLLEQFVWNLRKIPQLLHPLLFRSCASLLRLDLMLLLLLCVKLYIRPQRWCYNPLKYWPKKMVWKIDWDLKQLFIVVKILIHWSNWNIIDFRLSKCHLFSSSKIALCSWYAWNETAWVESYGMVQMS